MADRVRKLLLGYLIGALDDSERRRIQRRLHSDPRWQAELLAVRESLETLRLARETYEPPEGLAARTCQYLAMFAPPSARPAARSPAVEQRALRRARRMTAAFAPPSSRSTWSWADLCVAAVILVLLSCLVFPAVQSSRVHARMIACQNNLRDIGTNLVQRRESDPGLAFHGPEPREPAHVDPSAPLVYCTMGPGRDAISASDDVIGGRDGIGAADEVIGAVLATRPIDVPAGPTFPIASQETVPDVSLSWLSAPRPGHHGVSDSTRGQNVLFGDGRVTFVAAGWHPPSDDDWVSEPSTGLPGATPTVLRP